MLGAHPDVDGWGCGMSDERSSGYYARIMGTFWRHPRTSGLSLAARGLWVSLVSWSADQRSDGDVPVHALAMACGGRADMKALAELERVELVARVESTLVLRNWAKHNITREKHDREKERARNGMANKRGTKAASAPSVTRNKVVSDDQPSDQDQDQDQRSPSGDLPRAREPSLTEAADRARKLIADGYKSRGLAVPSKVASLAATAEITAALAGIPFEALPEILEKFFSDPEIIERKWPVSWLLTNANQWGSSVLASASTALPADLDDAERIAVERARAGRWPNPNGKLAAAHARVLARHPGICPPRPEVLS